MAKKLYRLKNSIQSLDTASLLSVYQELEESLRSKLTYSPGPIFPEQTKEIKATYPEGLRKRMREKIAAAAGGGKPTPRHVYNGIQEALLDQARERAKARVGQGRDIASCTRQEIKLYAADIALSMFLKRAPLPGDLSVRREISDQTFHVQASDRPLRLVVNKDDVDQADLFIFAIYSADLQRAWLTGWADKNDLLAAPCGNKETDPENCSWRQMAHYIPFNGLKPILDLVPKLSAAPEGFAEGAFFETVPGAAQLPVPAGIKLPDLSKPDPGDDFLGEKAEAQAQQSQEDTSIKDVDDF